MDYKDLYKKYDENKVNIFYIFNHSSYDKTQRKVGGSRGIFGRFGGYITPFDTLGRFGIVLFSQK
jgi:hypothetical protein